MKLVVIGGVAGGASAAARVRRLDANAEIVIFEKGEHVSFSNCCLPYHLSGAVQNSESLVLMSPMKFKKQHNIDARTGCEVISINRESKTVTVKNLLSGEVFDESYDKLVLAPGANPIIPAGLVGADRKNVFAIRNVGDIRAVKACLDLEETKNVVVVGGGFIGIETAENIAHAGKNVTLLARGAQILPPFDYDMVQIINKELDDKGIKLMLNTSPTAVEEGFVKAVSKSGKVSMIPADAVILAAGVEPETSLAKAAGLEIGASKGIKVNHNYQTNDPDIYAVGDAVEIFSALTNTWGRLALAGPAQRQARAAADHIYGLHHSNRGYIGSSCLRVFELNCAATGLSEKAAKKAGFNCDSVLVFPPDKVGIMPDSHYMAFKLIFEVPTGRILGAQAIGKGAADKRIDVIAAMISMKAELEDLKELELCYSPVYSTAKDVVNQAALVALNILYGRYKQVHVDKVRNLVEGGAYIVDVREENEYKAGHLMGAHNIPLSQLQERMNEIPKDIPVYLHCRSSQRSYYAICRLQGNGWKNVVNISGSYLGISLFEYFNDKTLGRVPIMDKYNFK